MGVVVSQAGSSSFSESDISGVSIWHEKKT